MPREPVFDEAGMEKGYAGETRLDAAERHLRNAHRGPTLVQKSDHLERALAVALAEIRSLRLRLGIVDD
jgi:hypothetical protein